MLDPRRLEPLLDSLHSALETDAAAAERALQDQAGTAAAHPPDGNSWAELVKEFRGREQWLRATDHRQSETGVGRQLDQIDAMVRQRRLRAAVRSLADANGNNLLQEERLQELVEFFCRCAGETVCHEDADVVLQTLAALNDWEGSGEAPHQLVMVLLAVLPDRPVEEGLTSPANSEGLTFQIAEWKRRASATQHARELCSFIAATCSDAKAATIEERAAALEHLQKREKWLETDPIPRALGNAASKDVERLQTWLALTCEATLRSCKSALDGALPRFRETAGGRRDGGHWQAALTGSSKSEDVLREARHHLLTPDASGKAHSERVAALSTELAARVTALREALSASAACAVVGAAVAGVTAQEGECKALVANAETAMASARVVETEGFFCQVPDIRLQA